MAKENVLSESLIDDSKSDLISGIATELRSIIQSVPKEEADIFMELISNDDTEAFENKMQELHKSKNSDPRKTPPRISVDKELEGEVIRAVLQYFDNDSKTKKEEAFELEKIFTIGVEPQRLSENKARVLSRSENPYIRMMVASHGFCSKTLSNDPVSYIRLEVLKRTGVYSAHYREKETNLAVIKELIKQGIDNDFYRTFNDQTRYMVEVQEAADDIIETIESGCKETHQDFMRKLKQYPAEQERYQEAQMHIDIVMQDLENSLSTKNKSEVLKENKKTILAKDVLEKIKVGEETPLGIVKSIQQDKITIESYEPEGLEIDYHPSELHEHISLSKTEDGQALKK